MSIATKPHKQTARLDGRSLELERRRAGLEEDLKEVLADLRHNEMMFNLEIEPDLVEQRIYERQALRCRYRYLIERARELGLRTILHEEA